LGVPSAAGLWLEVRETHSGRWIGNADEKLAGGALNLAARVAGVALQGLIAARTIEFEICRVHSFHKEMREAEAKSMRNRLQDLPILFHGRSRMWN